MAGQVADTSLRALTTASLVGTGEDRIVRRGLSNASER